LKNRLTVNLAELEERRGSKFKGIDELKEELAGLKAEAAIVKAMPPLSESQAQNQSEPQVVRRGPGRSIISGALDREYDE